MKQSYQRVVADIYLNRKWMKPIKFSPCSIEINGKKFYKPSPLKNELKFSKPNKFLFYKKKLYKMTQ